MSVYFGLSQAEIKFIKSLVEFGHWSFDIFHWSFRRGLDFMLLRCSPISNVQ